MKRSPLKQKLKICKGCGWPKKIFSHGLCVDCAEVNYPPLKRSAIQRKAKEIRADGNVLSQKEAFKKAYFEQKGRVFIFPEDYIPLKETTASNFAHVLRKSRYPWFKYYYRNIVILWDDQHHLFDNLTEEKLEERKQEFPGEDWDKLFRYQEELKKEYEVWIKEHPKEYK